MAEQTPIEAFRLVLGGTARALAHEPEVELSFTAEAPSSSYKQIRVPMPARNLPAQAVAEARGFADSFALKLRHHDQRIHDRTAPAEPVARFWSHAQGLGEAGESAPRFERRAEHPRNVLAQH